MNKVITIDLKKPRDAQSFKDPNEIIQKEAIQQFFRQVKDTFDKIGKFKDSLGSNEHFGLRQMRYHDTITISGSRGSGKTTFVLNMLELIQSASDGAHRNDAHPDKNMLIQDLGIPKDIKTLGILDPTLIEEKEHVFVNIISRIKVLVDNAREGNPDKTNRDCCGYSESKPKGNNGKYQDWLECLKTLAAGIPAIDGIGSDDFLKSERWHDPVQVMEQGLQLAQASNCLEINFHRYINKSLEFLGKEAFILAFDDIDTKFPSGWPVLETIRKYLTSPQLIIVLSGDFSLYSNLVRKQQWQNFGKALLKNERKFQQFQVHNSNAAPASPEDWAKDSFHHMVNQLEEQYLLKVLKPEKRLELDSLYQLSTATGQHTIIVHDKTEKSEDIKRCIEEIFRFVHQLDPCLWPFDKAAGSANRADLAFYRDNLLREPVRTVIQFLFAHHDFLFRPEPNSSPSKLFVSQNTINALANIFDGALREHGFDPGFAKHPDPETALNQLVINLAQAGILDWGYRLKAESDDSSLNRLMWVLGALFVHLFRYQPNLYFDFLVKVGLSREMALRLPATFQQNRVTLDDYLRWVGIKAGEDAMTIARMATGPMRAFVDSGNKTTPTHLGTVALRAFRSKRTKQITDTFNREEIRQLYAVPLQDDQFTAELRSLLAEDSKINRHVRPFISETARVTLTVKPKYNQPGIHKAYYINSLPELENNITSWHRVLINLPASQLVDSFGARTTYYSIHCLVAFIGQMLDSDDILSSLQKFSQLRDHLWPKWQRQEGIAPQKETTAADEEEEEGSQDNPLDTTLPGLDDVNVFAKALEKWRDRLKSVVAKHPLPTHVWAKVFTRFYYSLGQIDAAVGRKDRYLGFLVHRYLIVFLNAVLVEEALYRNLGGLVSLRNPTGSDAIFFKNIGMIMKGCNSSDELIYPKLPFFSCIYTLPLIWNFIDVGNDNPVADGLSDIKQNDEASNYRYKHEALSYIHKYYFDRNISPEYIFTCRYCDSVSFVNLYPLLNSVPIHFDKIKSTQDLSEKSSQPTSTSTKPDWNNKFFEKFIRKQGDKLNSEMESCVNVDEATTQLIKYWIMPNFKRSSLNKNWIARPNLEDLVRKEWFTPK